ncbi:MAG: hypothetical protein DME06_05615 [Candidatus Rokuibacteriota bacterium]|nr:MAG: hypothetical protein DME06_05615 [Candidatus Rokubacteria bacterium]
MTPSWTHIPLGLRVAALGLVLASCAAQGRPTASSASVGQTTAAAESSGVPASAVPLPTTVATDLNRKLLSHLTPPTEETDLPLGPGDLIEISVFDVPELSSLKLRVPVGGSVTLPLIGAIPAAGLTPSELETEVRTRLRQDYMNDPQVSVFVTEQKSQRVSVMGAVKTGGVYSLAGHLRLADALAMAGGLADDAGHTVYVTRRTPAAAVASARADRVATDGAGAPRAKTSSRPPDGVMQEVMTAIDLEALADGNKELNLPLQAGDVIDVPRAGSFYVGGAVEKPGSFLLKSRTTVQQAVVAAGGAKEVADWDDVRLYRLGAGGKREVFTYSLNDFEGGKSAPEVRQGDVVVVGKSAVKAFAYGVRDFLKFGVYSSVPIP